MQRFILVMFSVILMLQSCGTTIEVDELCSVYSYVDGEYSDGMAIYALKEDNDASNNEVDTLYFKVEKQTQDRYRLKGRTEYESLKNNTDFELERYFYLKGSNQTEKAWRTTKIPYKARKKHTKKRGESLCDKDFNIQFQEEIKKRLMKKGYPVSPYSDQIFARTEIKKALIKYQKDHNLPYGKLDLVTLEKLGIKVVTK